MLAPIRRWSQRTEDRGPTATFGRSSTKDSEPRTVDPQRRTRSKRRCRTPVDEWTKPVTSTAWVPRERRRHESTERVLENRFEPDFWSAETPDHESAVRHSNGVRRVDVRAGIVADIRLQVVARRREAFEPAEDFRLRSRSRHTQLPWKCASLGQEVHDNRRGSNDEPAGTRRGQRRLSGRGVQHELAVANERPHEIAGRRFAVEAFFRPKLALRHRDIRRGPFSRPPGRESVDPPARPPPRAA